MRPRQILVSDGFQVCPYRPGQVARLPLWRQLAHLDPAVTDARLANGERRVGRALYKPTCPTCHACRPIRILVDEFQPNKSQRRVLKKWEGRGRVDIGPVTVTDEKLELYNRHKFGRALAEPDGEPMDAEGYAGWLVDSCMASVEMRYYLDDRLIGVGIVDVGQVAASSVYFYFDPDAEALSPGVYSVLQEVEMCRRTARKYLYLGLYVSDCKSLAYKADYQPHERYEDGDWRRFERNDPVRR